MKTTTNLLLAFVSGSLLTLAFAPFNWYPIAYFSAAVICFLWLKAKPWRSFLLGLAYGAGFFAFATSWVFISIHTFGNTPYLIALLVTGLFTLILSLFFATQGLITSYLMTKVSPISACLFLFPATWVIWEYFRSIAFTGFPWVLLGYSQINSALSGFAPLLSVYGVSLVTAMIAGALVVLLLQGFASKAKMTGIAMVLLIFISAFSLNNFHWTKKSGNAFTVSLVQGNIAQTKKWDAQYLLSIINTYLRLTVQHWNAQLIVWPEAAIPALPQQVQAFIAPLAAKAKLDNKAIVFGAPLYNQEDQQYFNGLLMLGGNNGVYKKRHLVPFGEYFPLQSIFGWFYRYFQIPMSNFTAGKAEQKPLQFNHIKIASFICYEIIYPVEVLHSTINRQLMITVSDDSWFGNSIALNQHLQMAQMRAKEMGRYLLLAANTGITAIINPQGEIVAQLPESKTAVLTNQVTAMTGSTPLMKLGFYPLILIIMLLLFMAIAVR